VELPVPVPAVVTQPADQFMPDGRARLNGLVNPIGSPALAWFEWGTSPAYGNVTPPQSAGSGSNAVSFSDVIVGLVGGTEYHFRARASNAFGLAAGLDRTFTLSDQPPVVTTLPADEVSGTGARLRGQVDPRGWPTTAWFEWGTNANFGNSIGMQAVQGSGVASLDVVLDGLTSGPVYRYRLVASNVFGAVYGAEQTFSLAQVNYLVNSSVGGAMVIGSPNASGDIVIASTYGGSPVVWINGSAFSGCTNLTSVTIPSSVTVIQSPVFSGCRNLMNISVDAANPAFSSLDGVLFNKTQTTLIAFPPGRGSYVIPNSVTSIAASAFVNCTGLTNVTIPDSVTSLGQAAFAGCTGLTNVTIPDNVTAIGNGAFLGCTSLTNVTIPNSVTSIGSAAFQNCTGLTRVTIGNSVASLGLFPFDGCKSLTNFSVDAANPAYSSLNGVWFNKAQTTLILFPPGRGGSYVIPGSVTNIGSRAFEHCTSLTGVTIPNGVISIGGEAFNDCTNLTSVTIPDSVTQIGTTLYAGSGGSAFAYCTRLTNVIIGNSVTNIGSKAFSACSNLTRLTIPASVINLGFAAFYGSSRLTNFTFLGNAPQRAFDFDGGFAQFQNVGAGAKVCYHCGTTGWGATYGGLPTVMLCPPQIAPGSAGMKPGGFGFTLTRLTNQTVVEASTNLADWQPIWTNTLPGASANFVDPEWLQRSNRFYRARSD
jgi:hypothetical protein